jgi:hypothetical protein
VQVALIWRNMSLSSLNATQDKKISVIWAVL